MVFVRHWYLKASCTGVEVMADTVDERTCIGISSGLHGMYHLLVQCNSLFLNAYM